MVVPAEVQAGRRGEEEPMSWLLIKDRSRLVSNKWA